MSVSVVVATYGHGWWHEQALCRAIPSAQKEDPFEIIQEHQPDGTICTSRNAGADRATGDWLLFLDADDELAPGYVGAMERALERESSVGGRLLLTPAVQTVRNGKPGAPFFFPECSFETGNWIVIGTLIQRDFFHEVGGFHEHPHGLEDWNLWARCVKAGARIVRVPDAHYRAFYNRRSKHHELRRDRKAYMEAYERARASVWG